MGKASRLRRRKPQFVATPDPWISAVGVYSWESQAAQFAPLGAPGIEHRIEYADNYPTLPINVWLHRDSDGRLSGILYHYPNDMPPLEKAGNINMWVREDRQRQGIGSKMLAVAERHLGVVNFSQQRYSASGAAMVNNYLRAEPIRRG